MARRKKRTRGLKQALLTAAAVVAGSTTATACHPVICDPAPPPSTAPRPTADRTVTPMICDPPPPPSIVRPTAGPTMTPMICDPPPPPLPSAAPPATPTPMICDPAPPPSPTPLGQATATPAAAREFRVRSVEVSVDRTLPGARIEGTVLGAQGRPVGNVWAGVQSGDYRMQVRTGADGAFGLPLPGPGTYMLTIGSDQAHGLALELKAQERATVVWEEVTQVALPLAEIREVRIAWQGGLGFAAESPWPGARCAWSVSGGALAGVGDTVTWQPPAAPGRYLLQVVADWGAAGLAVDAQVLTVEHGGRIVVG